MLMGIFRLIFNSFVIIFLLIVVVSYSVGFWLGKESMELKAIEKGYGRYEKVLTDYKPDGSRNTERIFCWKDETVTQVVEASKPKSK